MFYYHNIRGISWGTIWNIRGTLKRNLVTKCMSCVQGSKLQLCEKWNLPANVWDANRTWYLTAEGVSIGRKYEMNICCARKEGSRNNIQADRSLTPADSAHTSLNISGRLKLVFAGFEQFVFQLNYNLSFYSFVYFSFVLFNLLFCIFFLGHAHLDWLKPGDSLKLTSTEL